MKSNTLVLLLSIISLMSCCTKDFVCECSIIQTNGVDTTINSTFENVKGTRFNLGDECPRYQTDYENGITIHTRCALQ